MSDQPQSDPEDVMEMRRQILLQCGVQEGGVSTDFIKWTIASLQLLNGGAIVAFLGNDETRATIFEIAGWCFASGLLCSLLTGVAASKFYENTSSNLLERLWLNDGVTLPSLGEAYHLAQTRPSVVLTFVFGLLSFILFIAGCWVVSRGH